VAFGSPYAAQLHRSSDFSLDNLQKTPVITEKILNRKLSAQTTVYSQNLVISWLKVHNNDGAPSVALFCSNSTSSDISNVELNFSVPQSLRIQLQSDNVHTVSGNLVKIARIPAFSTAIQVFPVSFILSTSPNTSFNVALSFTSEARPLFGKFDITLSAFDFIVPTQMAIGNYATEWQQNTVEKQQLIPNQTINSPEVFKEIISKANFHVLQVQQNEIICCSKFLNGDAAPLCLLYAKIAPHQLSLQLRTKDSMLTEYVSGQLRNLFNLK